MSQPEGQGVPMATVLEVQRRRIAQLTEQNIMLEAMLDEKETQIKRMLSDRD